MGARVGSIEFCSLHLHIDPGQKDSNTHATNEVAEVVPGSMPLAKHKNHLPEV